jgi:hypothetical protein
MMLRRRLILITFRRSGSRQTKDGANPIADQYAG